MKNGFLSVLLLLLCAFSRAQQVPLIAKVEGGKLLLPHTVQAKENWYSIGRIYNISPKELAPFNGTTIEKGLSIGQSLKVPLEATNFTQTGGAAPDEVLVPVHHVVEPKEGLYHISQTYGKVPLESLRKWNKLSSDNLSTGTKLIVGYLKVKKDQSPLASAAIKTDLPAQAVTTEHKAPPVTPAPIDQPVARTDTKAPPQPVKPAPEPVKTAPVITPTVPSSTTNVASGPGNGGAFKPQYEEQTRSASASSVTGAGAVFKSTSGWKDAKYYALMNKVTPGTIVRVTNPANSRSVYAKVLGEIPPGKENDGLMIRISNAAASELSIPETAHADLQLSFVK
jgi:LysM repeat protein